MTFSVESLQDMFDGAERLITLSNEILNDAPLTAQQRNDLKAIASAATQFRIVAEHNATQITDGADPDTLQRLRHDLLNHLNIVTGFSKLLARELPDNLLLYMITIRQIQNTSDALSQAVRLIR